MSAHDRPPAHPAGTGAEVCVRFWASARTAAGVEEVSLRVPGEVGLDALVDLVLHHLSDRPDLGRVLGVCSVLVGDRPAGTAERTAVVVTPGSTVEFLPPFAGG